MNPMNLWQNVNNCPFDCPSDCAEMPKDASDKNKTDDIKQYYGQK